MQLFQDLMPSLHLRRWTPAVLRKHLLNEETESIESLCRMMMESDGEYSSLLLAERILNAYEGLDVVLLRNPAEDVPLEPAVQEALLDWVEAGGRLVVTATRRPDLIADTPRGRALPASHSSCRPPHRIRVSPMSSTRHRTSTPARVISGPCSTGSTP